MNQTIEVNIADILNRLESKIDGLNDKIDNASNQMNAEVKTLNDKIDHVSHQLENKIDNVSHQLENKIDNVSHQLENKIDNVSHQLENKIDNLSTDVNEVKVGVAKLNESKENFAKRLDNVEFTNRGIFVVFATILIGLVVSAVKIISFPNL